MLQKQVVNLPNAITLFRIVVLPLLAILIVKDKRVFATIVMAIAGISDILDGWYARHYRQESPLGKLMDPVADKILLCVAILFLVSRPQESLDPWLGTLLLAREFLITGLRAFAASSGMVLAAGDIGKMKTVFQFFGIGFVIIGGAITWIPARTIGLGALWASVILSYWSMVNYLRVVYFELRANGALNRVT